MGVSGRWKFIPLHLPLGTVSSMAFVATIVLPAIDYRFSWSEVPIYIVILGNILVILGYSRKTHLRLPLLKLPRVRRLYRLAVGNTDATPCTVEGSLCTSECRLPSVPTGDFWRSLQSRL